MKGVIKISGVLILICLINISTSGKKNESVLSLLQKKTWILQKVSGVKITEEYEHRRHIIFIDGKQAGVFEFYLSNSIDPVFNNEKHDLTENGKYIIERLERDKSDKRPTPVNWVEIVEISKDKLVLKGKSHTLTYKPE